MDALLINGGCPLFGTVAAGGAKNAALPLLAATILASEPVCLRRVPRLADVDTLSLLLGYLGVEVAVLGDGVVRISTVDAAPIQAPLALVRRMRASFCVLGPLLARRGRAIVPMPGGCRIGDRPVDLHLKGLAALGAEVRVSRGYVLARARRLRGATIDLHGPRGPTVTGTANVMSAAVLARGATRIVGAAVEPEIVDLGRFLIALGARIDGLGTPLIEITGVDQLGGADHRIIPDRIETGTLLLAAAITGGSITVAHAEPRHLDALLLALQMAGCELAVAADRVTVTAGGRPRPLDLVAAPYPGFPTDLQSQWIALMALADGRSLVTDRVFPDRYLHITELNRLGAEITRHGQTAVVSGVSQLHGARVRAMDLRAGAALVLAGLAAEGQTHIRRIAHLDRGYERLDEKLNQLGANIRRSQSTQTLSAA